MSAPTIPAGMTAWGPEHADYPGPPRNRDGPKVQLRDGSIIAPRGGRARTWDWGRRSGRRESDIIAYEARPATAAEPLATDALGMTETGEVSQGQAALGNLIETADHLVDSLVDSYLRICKGRLVRDLAEAEGVYDAAKAFARASLAHADTQTAALRAERDALRDAAGEILRLERSITTDVASCHSLRGPGASSAMREDDRDMRQDMGAAFAFLRAALTTGKGEA